MPAVCCALGVYDVMDWWLCTISGDSNSDKNVVNNASSIAIGQSTLTCCGRVWAYLWVLVHAHGMALHRGHPLLRSVSRTQ